MSVYNTLMNNSFSALTGNLIEFLLQRLEWLIRRNLRQFQRKSEMLRWLKNLGFEASEHQMQDKNNQRPVETYSLFSIYLVGIINGMRWKLDIIMWDKPDWQRYSGNIDDLETNSDYYSDDKEFLQIEWKKQYLVDKDLQLNAQKRFLGLLRNAVKDHPEISFRMESVFKQVSPLDFLQGSRALVMRRRAIRDMIHSDTGRGSKNPKFCAGIG